MEFYLFIMFLYVIIIITDWTNYAFGTCNFSLYRSKTTYAFCFAVY